MLLGHEYFRPEAELSEGLMGFILSCPLHISDLQRETGILVSHTHTDSLDHTNDDHTSSPEVFSVRVFLSLAGFRITN